MKEALKIAVKAVDDKKGVDIAVLDISQISSFTSFFLFCSGDSSRQIQAIADEVQEQLRAHDVRPDHVEGYGNAEWILLDYSDLVVHIFSKKARSYYDLERLWRDGKHLDVTKLLKPPVRKAVSRKPR